MLDHASIISTEIYTQVAIRKLKEVYELTHPGAKLARRAKSNDEGRDELLSSLAAEAAEEEQLTRSTTPPKTERPRATWFLR